jgi:hypothetical protein
MKTKSKLEEKKLSKAELEAREKVIKDLKKNKSALVKRYGKDAEAVMYGRATNIAKKMAESENKNRIKELVRKSLMQEADIEVDADRYEGEQKLSQASMMLDALEGLLKKHDWYYMMSDDNRAYTQGSAQQYEIRKIMKQLEDIEYGDDAKALFNKYSPDGQGGISLKLKEDMDVAIEMTTQETSGHAERFAKYMSDKEGKTFTVTNDSVEGPSFDLDLDGEKYEGGSYIISKSGDIINMALPNNPVYANTTMLEGKKEDMDKDGDIDSKDYLLKRDAAIKKAKGDIDESGYREMTASERAKKQRMDNQLKTLSDLKKRQEDKERLLKLQQKLHQDKTKSFMKEEELEEAYVPSNIKEFAKRKGATSLVNKVAGWAEKAGKGIRGGTAIGKNYSTLILDLGYQDGAIRINLDDDTVELYGEEVFDVKSFKQVYLDNQEESKDSEMNEDIDLGHEDNEPHMIKSELYRIGKYAMELYAMAEELEETGKEIDFPAWWQSMITDAASKMVKAKHYLDFELKEPYIDAAVDAATGEAPHMGEPEAPMMEAEIGKDEMLAGKIMKALKDMANKDASDQHNLKQARIALNKGNIDAAEKIAKPYLSEKIAKLLKSK